MNNNKSPLVSFVVNCYNGDVYLKSCLSSILDQTYSNWELIFWDNASTDKSEEIFKSYKNPRFKYFRSKENVSLGQARNWAVNECKGEYIAFLDVDDEWFPEKTTIQVNAMLQDNYVLCYAGINSIIEESGKSKVDIPKFCSGYIFRDNLLQFEINLPTAMIYKKALKSKKLNFDRNIKASEEYCLFMQLIYNEKVCVINDSLATYLIRGDSLTVECISYWSYERRYTLDKIKHKFPDSLLTYKKEYLEAYARADFYDIRYFMHMNNIDAARKAIKKIMFISWKYFITYIILLFPIPIWKIVIKIYYNR